MNIIGIIAIYHDDDAVLVSDGRIVAAAQEERFTRRKHDASFPVHACAIAGRRGASAPANWAESLSTTSRWPYSTASCRPIFSWRRSGYGRS